MKNQVIKSKRNVPPSEIEAYSIVENTEFCYITDNKVNSLKGMDAVVALQTAKIYLNLYNIAGVMKSDLTAKEYLINAIKLN